MRVPLILTATLALLGTASSAALSGTYIGTVGTLPIVMTFGGVDSQYEHRYFYRRVGQDIPLEQAVVGKRVTLTEYTAYPDRRVNATFSGTLEGGVLRGTYALKKPGSKALAFSLRPVTRADLNSPLNTPWLEGLKKTDPYTALKFDAPLLRGQYLPEGTANSAQTAPLKNVVGKQMGYSYFFLSEAKSRISLPRLEGAMFARVNAALEGHQLETARSALECSSSIDGSSERSFDYTPRLTYVSKTLVSVSAQVDLYCGGAHPSSYTDTLTLEVASGRALRLEDLYRFAPLPRGLDLEKLEPFEQYNAYVTARQKVLEPLVYAAAPELRRGETAECYAGGAEAGLDAWKEVTWSLSSKGLVLTSVFPHVAAVCEIPVTVPFKALERYRVSNLAP